MNILSTGMSLIYLISTIYSPIASRKCIFDALIDTKPFYIEESLDIVETVKEEIKEHGVSYLVKENNDDKRFIFSKFIKQLDDIAKFEKIKSNIVYNPNDLRQKSNLTKADIKKLLEGSKLQSLSETYYEMEKKYNVNAIFLMALNMEESGHGRSFLAQHQNNLGGVKNRSGGFAYFSSWEHSLEYIANLIDTEYLHNDGKYYNGTSVYGVNKRYCEGDQWAHNLNNIASRILKQVEEVL